MPLTGMATVLVSEDSPSQVPAEWLVAKGQIDSSPPVTVIWAAGFCATKSESFTD